MQTIIIPALIVAAIGLVAAVILTIASRLMYVPVDEKVSQIREVLPGANCGACGFAGCDDYAGAFSDDPDLSPTMCPVGGAEVAVKIAGILGVETGSADPEAAMVMCQGNYEVKMAIMDAEGFHTCRDANALYNGKWACPRSCLGLGDCRDACKFDAIRIENGVAVIDREKCVGCGSCVKVCPNNIISMVSKKNLVLVACKNTDKGAKTMKACKVGCIGCMKCQKACKFDAVKVENNLAEIDQEACRNCGLCQKECPTGAIVNFRKAKAAVQK